MVNIERIDDDAQWNEYVERATGGTVFHRSEFLGTAAWETGAELFRLVGKKGEHPIGIFPIFLMRKGPATLAVSPPPKTGIPYLGPAFITDPNIKFRKRAKTAHRFIKECQEWIQETLSPQYTRFLCNPRHTDTRQLKWDGYDVTPFFTHRLDIDRDEESLLKSFSRDARSSITDEYSTEYTIEERGHEAIDYIAQRLQERYEDQGLSFALSPASYNRLYDQLPDETIRAPLFLIDGEPVTGRISLMTDSKVWLWQGIPKPKMDVDIPTNDLLNWESIQYARSRGCTTADLSSGNTERLWTTKAKFNPELVPYHEAVLSSPMMSLASKFYQKI